MSYTNTFITVAQDCPVLQSEVPPVKGGKKTLHGLQYELLLAHPYRYRHEDLIYEVYIRQQGFSEAVVKKDGARIRKELLSKGHPCLRASALTKRYGFGAHYNEHGTIALYPLESAEYQAWLHHPATKVIPAMRSKK